VHAGVLLVASRRAFGVRDVDGTRRRLALLLLAALVMGAAVWLVARLLAPWLAAEALFTKAGALALVCVGGVIVYGAAAWLLGAVDPRLWRKPA